MYSDHPREQALMHYKALARAIYARRKIIILDDVFSGLDAETESKVFKNLLGSGGLLRQLHATVLLASSSG
jgi:ATP-binding cassette, subfamily C (CFTR/MRP), member 1